MSLDLTIWTDLAERNVTAFRLALDTGQGARSHNVLTSCLACSGIPEPIIQMDKQLKTVPVYNNFVQSYADKFMKMDLYEDAWVDFLALLPQNAELLELGCGPGKRHPVLFG